MGHFSSIDVRIECHYLTPVSYYQQNYIEKSNPVGTFDITRTFTDCDQLVYVVVQGKCGEPGI